MALATRCPHCQTTFRVAHDQLKLRAGLVRCGACKEIFNGVEHLLRPEETQQVLAATKAKTSSAQANAAPPPASAHEPSDSQMPADTGVAASTTDMAQAASPSPDAEQSPTHNEDAPRVADLTGQNAVSDENIRSAASEEAPNDSSQIDPLQRMTLMDFTAFDTQFAAEESGANNEDLHSAGDNLGRTADIHAASNNDDELSQAIDDLKNKPWRSGKQKKARRSIAKDAGNRGKAEPGFMARARRQKRYGKALRITMGAGSALLFIVLFLQCVFVFRDTIAATLPQYRPVLTSLCTQFGCQVKLPAQIDKVSIESSELQSLPSAPSKFTLVALLRNQATVDQAWPYLELTLNDMNEKPVARKVFLPRDYLASAKDAAAGFTAQSEQQVKLSFEMLQLKAAGYRLYLFYP